MIKLCKVIAVLSEKGGVAKTTVSVNMAYTLGFGADVLLIDMDPQGNATKMLGLRPEPEDRSKKKEGYFYYASSLYELIMDQIKIIFGQGNDFKVDNSIQKTRWMMDCIPNDRNTQRIDYSLYEFADLVPTGADIKRIWDEQFHSFLFNAVNLIKDRYEYIIIDCPPSFDFFSMNACMATDYVIIPVGTDEMEIQGLEDMFDDLEWFKREYNPELTVLGIVLTRYRGKSNLELDLEKQLGADKRYGNLIFKSVVREGVVYKEAAAKGQPAGSYKKKGSSVVPREDFQRLVMEVQEWIARIEVRRQVATTKEK